jgi:hypothetical protein
MRMLVALAALLLTLAACGSDGESTAVDPGGPPDETAQAMPTEAPTPAGEVRSRRLATVMDTGTPELCLGPVAESYPPQCGGPEITDWDWKTHGQQMFEQQGEVRWGTYAVTGTWDSTAFAVSEAIPGPLYDPMPEEPSEVPSPGASYDEADLTRIQDEVQELPGAQGAYVGDGHVFVEVMYDDGSLQAWADQEYGDAVVVVTSLLVDA